MALQEHIIGKIPALKPRYVPGIPSPKWVGQTNEWRSGILILNGDSSLDCSLSRICFHTSKWLITYTLNKIAVCHKKHYLKYFFITIFLRKLFDHFFSLSKNKQFWAGAYILMSNEIASLFRCA